jgi:hypothetical protein
MADVGAEKSGDAAPASGPDAVSAEMGTQRETA